jgi:hypothetical protein
VDRPVPKLGRLEALVNVDAVVPIDVKMLLDIRADRRDLGLGVGDDAPPTEVGKLVDRIAHLSALSNNLLCEARK